MLALGLAAPMGSGGPSDVTVGPFGSSAPGAADGSSGSWGLNSIGLPGGTPWYMKPGALSNLTGGSGGAGKPGGGIGQWLGNLKKSFWNEDINLAPGKTVAASGIGGIKGDMAGVLTSQGAAGLYMAAGIPLGMAGLAGNSRGTWKGIGMSTAGGALVGASIGTMILPGIGTAIGAGVGAAAGFVAGGLEKLFGVESAQNEAKRLVKSIYGVSIDNALAQQIAEIAKQKYSGHVSMAVRDPDVRKTIELYAQASGQKMPISATTPHGASAVEQGGTMYQEATYNMGNPYTWRSSMPTLGGIGSSNYPSPGPTLMQVFVDGKGSGDYMAGNIFTPSFVQSRFSDAGQSSDGRTSNAAMLQQANLIVG